MTAHDDWLDEDDPDDMIEKWRDGDFDDEPEEPEIGDHRSDERERLINQRY